ILGHPLSRMMTPSVPHRKRSIILQQPLDVIELDLRAVRIAEAAAELFQNSARPLHVDFAGNHLRQFVAEFASAQRTSERIGLIAAILLTAHAVAGSVGLPVAVSLMHRLRHALGALA